MRLLAPLFLFAAVSCSATPDAVYEVPVLPASMVATQLKSACERSAAESRPMLVEFSAEWCSGCQLLFRMEQREPLTSELMNWERLVVNIGQFDQHMDLLETFGVREIPHWVMLSGEDCSAPAREWKPVRSRSVRLGEGTRPAGLAEYLGAIRQLPPS